MHVIDFNPLTREKIADPKKKTDETRNNKQNKIKWNKSEPIWNEALCVVCTEKFENCLIQRFCITHFHLLRKY